MGMVNAEEHEKRVSMAMYLLSNGARPGEVKRQLSAMFNVSPRSVERYMTRAREELVKMAGAEDQEELKGRLVFVCFRCIRDSNATWKEKLMAIDRICNMIRGLRAESRVELSGREGGPIEVAADFEREIEHIVKAELEGGDEAAGGEG